MSNIMKRFRVLAMGIAVIGLSPVVEAQRQQDGQFNENQNFQGQGQGQGRRGRQNNNTNENFNQRNLNQQNFNQQNFNQRNFNQQNFNQDFNQRNNRRNFPGVQVANGDYGIIASKSIFLRDRRDRVQQAGPQYIDPRTLPPEELLVVTGIVFEDGGFHAYVENLLEAGQTKLVIGNKIAAGEVEEITLDSLKYRKDGATESVSIPISSNLMGRRIDSIQGERLRLQTMTAGGSVGGAQPQPMVTTQFNRVNINNNNAGNGGNFGLGGGGGNRGRGNTTVTVPPPPLVGDSSLSVEERMRLRRMQEGQPGAQQPVVAVPIQEEPEPQEQPQVAPGGAGDSGASDGLSVEDRLRLRRAQEQGQ